MEEQSRSLLDTVIYAGFWRRLAAWAIDFAAVALLIGIATALSTFCLFAVPLLTGFLNLACMLGLGVAYHAGFESSQYQATPGKMLLGLRVTDIDGQRLKFNRALVRYWAMSISNLTGGIGYLMIPKTKKHQALHDMIANCLVVRKSKVLGCGHEHHAA